MNKQRSEIKYMMHFSAFSGSTKTCIQNQMNSKSMCSKLSFVCLFIQFVYNGSSTLI